MNSKKNFLRYFPPLGNLFNNFFTTFVVNYLDYALLYLIITYKFLSKMKKFLIFLVLAGIFVFTSCEKEQLENETLMFKESAKNGWFKGGKKIPLDELSTTITDYIAANYPDAEIVDARQKGEHTIVHLGDGMRLIFDADGNFVEELENIKPGNSGGNNGGGGNGFEVLDEVPAVIQDYLDTNKPDVEVQQAVRKKDKIFVLLSDNTVMVFDEEGNLLEESTEIPGGITELDEVPAVINDYVSANYPDAVIKKAIQKDEETYVILEDGKILVFDADGNFVEEKMHPGKPDKGKKGPISPDELPESILNYISMEYPDAEIQKALVKGNGKYMVRLLNGDVKVMIVFDDDGTVLYVKEG